MELENRSMKMLLQSMPKKGFALTFIVFFVVFLVCIIIGATGPKVYEYRGGNAWGDNCLNSQVFENCEGVDLLQNDTYWIGEIDNMDKLNQELVFAATLTNRDYKTHGLSKNIRIRVSIYGRTHSDESWSAVLLDDHHNRPLRCKENEYRCDNISLTRQVFIQHKSYRFNVSILNPPPSMGDVEFTYYFVNRSYTLFELWFRFVFLFFSFVGIILFTYQLRNYDLKEWLVEQKWALVLLMGLMAYNNPIYSLELLVNGWFPIFVNRVLYASFLVLLLLFWLITFDAIRMESSRRHFLTFYLPKIVLLVLFWMAGIAVFAWNQLHELENPAYTAPDELAGFIFFQVFMIILAVVYLLWLFYVIVRAVSDAKTLPYLGVRIKFFLAFTLLVIITIVLGAIFGVFASQNNAAEFLSFIALLNLYVYVLAFVYIPSKSSSMGGPTSSSKADRIGMVRLEDDDNDIRGEFN